MEMRLTQQSSVKHTIPHPISQCRPNVNNFGIRTSTTNFVQFVMLKKNLQFYFFVSCAEEFLSSASRHIYISITNKVANQLLDINWSVVDKNHEIVVYVNYIHKRKHSGSEKDTRVMYSIIDHPTIKALLYESGMILLRDFAAMSQFRLCARGSVVSTR
jgi:hypothetical protein